MFIHPSSSLPLSHSPAHSSIQPSIHPPIQPIIYSSTHPLIHPTINPSNHQSIHPPIQPIIHSSTHPPIHPTTHPSNFPSIQPQSIHPPMQPFVYPSIIHRLTHSPSGPFVKPSYLCINHLFIHLSPSPSHPPSIHPLSSLPLTWQSFWSDTLIPLSTLEKNLSCSPQVEYGEWDDGWTVCPQPSFRRKAVFFFMWPFLMSVFDKGWENAVKLTDIWSLGLFSESPLTSSISTGLILPPAASLLPFRWRSCRSPPQVCAHVPPALPCPTTALPIPHARSGAGGGQYDGGDLSRAFYLSLSYFEELSCVPWPFTYFLTLSCRRPHPALLDPSRPQSNQPVLHPSTAYHTLSTQILFWFASSHS